MVKGELSHREAPPLISVSTVVAGLIFCSCSFANRVPAGLYRGKGTRFAEQLLAAYDRFWRN
ncbi:hypothetical protein ES702_05103 [subsurface metagenome]